MEHPPLGHRHRPNHANTTVTVPKELVISTKIAETPNRSGHEIPDSQEMGQVARDLASLAFARMQQEGELLVRQQEQLRRALAATGRSLGWAGRAAHNADWEADVNKDVLRIARNGARSLTRDLAAQEASKKKEMVRLKDIAAATEKMAENPDTVYPTEITYLHTARDSVRDLVTKTEERVVNDADEAMGVVRTIEKNLARWEGLRDEMVIELKERQQEVAAMQRNLSSFVKSLQSLLEEVLVTLH